MAAPKKTLFSYNQSEDMQKKKKYLVEEWTNTNEPFAKGCARYFIVGTSNTGKTTLASRLIKQLLSSEEDPKQQLIIISPNYSRDHKLQKLAKLAAASDMTVKVYQSFDKASIRKFVEYMAECAESKTRSVVFIDDPIGIGHFTGSVNTKSPFNSFVTGVKHYRSDIVFSTQAIGSMSKSARKNVDVFIFLPDRTSRQELYDACRFVSTYQAFSRLMDMYASSPFNALWINVQYGSLGVYRIDSQGSIRSITSVPK